MRPVRSFFSVGAIVGCLALMFLSCGGNFEVEVLLAM
jgi:hypothetical protein